jgi:hypothetical protein
VDHLRWTHVTITPAMPGDGCCPAGASANTDTDTDAARSAGINDRSRRGVRRRIRPQVTAARPTVRSSRRSPNAWPRSERTIGLTVHAVTVRSVRCERWRYGGDADHAARCVAVIWSSAASTMVAPRTTAIAVISRSRWARWVGLMAMPPSGRSGHWQHQERRDHRPRRRSILTIRSAAPSVVSVRAEHLRRRVQSREVVGASDDRLSLAVGWGSTPEPHQHVGPGSVTGRSPET